MFLRIDLALALRSVREVVLAVIMESPGRPGIVPTLPIHLLLRIRRWEERDYGWGTVGRACPKGRGQRRGAGCVQDGARCAADTVERSRGRGEADGVLKIGPESIVHNAMRETQRNSLCDSPFVLR